MTNNVVKKPEKGSRAFKYIMIFVFSYLILVQISKFMTGPSWIERKHHIKFYKESIDINNNFIEGYDSGAYRISDFNGSKLILSFWAPWCGYCAKEMPVMSHLESQLEKKGYKIMPIVKNNESRDKIDQFYKRFRIKGMQTYVTSDRGLFAKLGVRGFPRFILVDENGMAVADMRPNWESGDILYLFSELDEIISKRDQASFPSP